jgi:hypothetical protein
VCPTRLGVGSVFGRAIYFGSRASRERGAGERPIIEANDQALEDRPGARCLIDEYRRTLPSLRDRS